MFIFLSYLGNVCVYYAHHIMFIEKKSADHIQQTINLFEWVIAFLNIEVDAVEVSAFSDTVLNIQNNCTSHETKIRENRDPL